MRNSNLGAIVGLTALLLAGTASAVEVDVNVAGVFTDSTFITLVDDFEVADDGDRATANLQSGYGILLTIDVANPNGDNVTDLFTTLIHDGSQLNYLGGDATRHGILYAFRGFQDDFLGRVADPEVKINSPNPDGVAGDVWVQSTAFAGRGTTGIGPNIEAVRLFYLVTGASGSDQIEFILTQTDGDPAVVGGLVGSGAILNVIPEPGTAFLIGLGLVGLASAGRRGPPAVCEA